MTRRNIELILLLLAAPMVALLFVVIAIREGQAVGFDSLSVPIGIFAAFVVAHLAARRLAPGADPALLPLSFALSGIGIAFITRIAPFSSVPTMAQNQVIWLFVGVAFMIIILALFRNLDKVANYKYTLMLVGIVLLLSPMIPALARKSTAAASGCTSEGSPSSPARSPRSSSCCSWQATWRKTARCSRCSPCASGRCACPTSARFCPF